MVQPMNLMAVVGTPSVGEILPGATSLCRDDPVDEQRVGAGVVGQTLDSVF
ncbi:hypothetical protein SH139x_002182 [Planctomycetaceae bacterium SH139]